MAGPNSAPNGDARLVRGYPGEGFVCVRKNCKHNENNCIMTSLRLTGVSTGKTKRG